MAAASTVVLEQAHVVGEPVVLKLEKSDLDCLRDGIPLPLPPRPSSERDSSVPHAPVRRPNLTAEEFKLALRNALRYFPEEFHAELAEEFAQELREYGHIYMYRLMPREYEMRARPIQDYPAKSKQAASIMLMIQNNLDPKVAQFPQELIVYGGNGSAFGNWAQYRLAMKYLSEMNEEQTLVLSSGHPVGLFPSHADAPRLVISNGMVIPNYSSREEYEKMYATGVTIYGQMTAGSYCYIGPQGIVHGTTLTVMNAGRKYLGREELAGVVFVTSGLGGMSGAQAKAGVIAGCVAIVAEINESALTKRHEQGWVQEVVKDLDSLIARIKRAREEKKPVSIAYLGNVVDVWERLASEEGELLAELGSDQTSLHNPYSGGYYPVGLSFDESNKMMVEEPEKFRDAVHASLRRHAAAINTLAKRGLNFWDYGNSFLLEASKAGADLLLPGSANRFIYPSYVQDIMGDIFSLGFGPFRWVCTSCSPKDLAETDRIAAEVIRDLASKAPEKSRAQYTDNLKWIIQAEENKLVVGSQARILYSDALGRVTMAEAFNKAIAEGRISAPIVLSRDHHDVSGADSPFRETSNIMDGSQFTADMAVQTFVGDSFRGATWIALHNGGGCGWGNVINCGHGLVLDGTPAAARRAKLMLWWDVNGGVARRSWSGNDNAEQTIQRMMDIDPLLRVTMPAHASDDVLERAFAAGGSGAAGKRQ